MLLTVTVEHFIFVRALFSYAGQMYENKAYENKGRTKILAYENKDFYSSKSD